MAVYERAMTRPEQGVILCGGLGKRLRPFTDRMPKPMIPCNGKPFLWYLLRQLHEQGVSRFVLLTGYLAEEIEEYFGDGSRWGWQIVYSEGPVQWDTGRRLWESRSLLDARFLLCYCDNFVPFSFGKVLRRHERHGLSLTFMISRKSPGNIAVGKNGIVQQYDKNRSIEVCDFVEIGYMVVERDRTFAFYEQPDCSFSTILQKMAENREISAWLQGDAYHSISDPERWKKTEAYLKPKKVLLIDRDGVINRKAPQGEYITTWEEFEWIAETREAMKSLSENGYSFVVISNQAGIGRGVVSRKAVDEINRRMVEELRRVQIPIEGVYLCPHHWEDECNCRKPEPGLFFKASQDLLLNLEQTFFIGDDPRDCIAAYNAGCRSIYIGDKANLSNLKRRHWPDLVVQDMTGCTKYLIEEMDAIFRNDD